MLDSGWLAEAGTRAEGTTRQPERQCRAPLGPPGSARNFDHAPRLDAAIGDRLYPSVSPGHRPNRNMHACFCKRKSTSKPEEKAVSALVRNPGWRSITDSSLITTAPCL
jgi:hypothetical protein